MFELIKRVIIFSPLLIVSIYYLVVLYVLHFSLDSFLFPHVNENITELPQPYLSANSGGDELLIRHYGDTKNKCVIFFPGQHGGIARYQRDLFPYLVKYGVSVFAVSYPGQDDAKGHGRLTELPGLVHSGLAMLKKVCHAKETVFVGRSLGSMVAVQEAVHWQPKGLVLDGITPSLSQAIHTYMENHWYLRPASVLPIRRILRHDVSLRTALNKLNSTKITIFQGSLDVRTPLLPARRAVAGHPNVKFIEVTGARHSNVYLKARVQYVKGIVTLLGTKLKM